MFYNSFAFILEISRDQLFSNIKNTVEMQMLYAFWPVFLVILEKSEDRLFSI